MQILSLELIGIPLWKLLLTTGFLIPSFITDLREKRVFLFPSLLGTITGLITGFVSNPGIRGAFEGMIPGVVIIVLAFLLKGAIGAGDGVILAMIGSFLGFRRAVAVLSAALIVSMIVALILLGLRKAGRKTQFPFVPFICLGFVITAFI